MPLPGWILGDISTGDPDNNLPMSFWKKYLARLFHVEMLTNEAHLILHFIYMTGEFGLR